MRARGACPAPHPVRQRLLVVAVVALAAVLRLWELGNVPGGLIWDEGQNALEVAGVLGGTWRIFFPRDGGQEPLFLYLQALAAATMGLNVLAVRFVPAAFGLLAVPATYVAVRRVAGAGALAAAAALATLPWAVIVSHTGVRQAAMPLSGALAVYALARALDERSERDAALFGALGGVVLAAAFASYVSGRVLPVVPVVCLAAVALRRCRRRRVAVVAAAGVLTAVVLVAPLAAYFARHPEDFWSRANQVRELELGGNSTDPGTLLTDGVVVSLRAFAFGEGDHRWDRNVPFRPAFDPLTGAVFVVGVVAAAAALRRRTGPLWLLVGFAVSLVPNALTGTRDPSFSRLTMAMPFAVGLVGVGVEAIATWSPTRVVQHLVRVGLILWVVLVGAKVYVVDWVQTPERYYTFGQDRTLALRAAGTASQGTARVFVAGGTPEDDVLPLLTLGQSAEQNVGLLDTVHAVAVAPGSPTTLFVPRGARPIASLRALLPAQSATLGRDPTGAPAVERFDLPNGELPRLARPLDVPVGDLARLTGVTAPRRVAPGKPFDVLISFTASRPDPRDLVWLVHVLDPSGQVQAGQDLQAYLASRWRRGDAAYLGYELQIPPGAPTGAYRVITALSDRDGFRHVPMGGGADSADLGALWVETRAQNVPAASAAPEVAFGSWIELSGHDLSVTSSQLSFSARWRAIGEPPTDYTFFVHALDASGKLVGQVDRPPKRPTSTWEQGDVVTDDFVLPRPPTAVALEVGFYEPSSVRRLPVAGGGDALRIALPGP